MSPLLLRRPNAVPSLFSQGCEEEDAPKSDRLAGRIARRLECFAATAGLDSEETILGRGGRALAGTSIAIFIVGLPLMKATSLVVGIALAR